MDDNQCKAILDGINEIIGHTFSTTKKSASELEKIGTQTLGMQGTNVAYYSTLSLLCFLMPSSMLSSEMLSSITNAVPAPFAAATIVASSVGLGLLCNHFIVNKKGSARRKQTDIREAESRNRIIIAKNEIIRNACFSAEAILKASQEAEYEQGIQVKTIASSTGSYEETLSHYKETEYWLRRIIADFDILATKKVLLNEFSSVLEASDSPIVLAEGFTSVGFLTGAYLSLLYYSCVYYICSGHIDFSSANLPVLSALTVGTAGGGFLEFLKYKNNYDIFTKFNLSLGDSSFPEHVDSACLALEKEQLSKDIDGRSYQFAQTIIAYFDLKRQLELFAECDKKPTDDDSAVLSLLLKNDESLY